MKIDHIASFYNFVAELRTQLQKVINYGIGRTYSVLLISVLIGELCRGQIEIHIAGMIEPCPPQRGFNEIGKNRRLGALPTS
jgi:hypothetical protein